MKFLSMIREWSAVGTLALVLIAGATLLFDARDDAADGMEKALDAKITGLENTFKAEMDGLGQTFGARIHGLEARFDDFNERLNRSGSNKQIDEIQASVNKLRQTVDKVAYELNVEKEK